MTSDPLTPFFGYALRRASNASVAQLTPALNALNLRLAEASTLVIIQGSPGITQSELGRMLDIASANMAPMIGRLDERGLISRVRVDGRSQGLRLTAEGEDLAAAALKAFRTHEEQLAAHIPPEFADVILETLNDIWQSE
ncbi:MAG: winged helix-turn-helix transcriptional regulator [Hyphomonadaceae bacterium]|nr:MAG: MarR family transcriptional regulator [Caulobacteraceae bacterium]MBT9447207.1 winged helix-turn-helix transcriptional regulator [Hyphomonadaceae bacterium]TPW08231.1 MAG: MarR family transcriptional regulator [Alphaproteobacteria bacterium]